MKMIFVVFAVLATAAAATEFDFTLGRGGDGEYAGHQVVRFAPVPATQVAVFEETLLLDVWEATAVADGSDGVSVVAAVSPDQLALLLMADEFKYEVLVDDLGALIAAERTRLQTTGAWSGRANEYFDDFRNYEEVHAYYRELVAAHPTLAGYDVIGTTAGGREVYGVRAGAGAGTRKLFWQCQIHAREWISAPTCAWMLTELLEGYGSDADATFVLDNFDVLFVPIVNPDGFAFTHSNDRMWRKNRANTTNPSCPGVDLNRNWPMAWQSASNPCSDSYPGTSRASERETQAVGSWLEAAGGVEFAVDLHSYGQLILRPWGYTLTATPDETVLKELGDGMRDAIRATHGRSYTSQRSAQLYPANGETTDYYYSDLPVGAGPKPKMWGFTFELRGNSFVIDPSEIVPQGEEIYASLVFAARWVHDNPPY